MQSAPIAHDTGETLVEDDTTTDELVADPLVADELLIEEISIDGMCGVY
jgi:mycofactocin precursor